ncbi:unnamed protein product [Mycena citricolor]|uniref:Adenosine deaminase domain-containing protein n=1 Tax=Mycena citricolor TaxID=2018698 RepID=A0AAD2JX63_9AGAR|nr:unnamed protein product [Mycena citricolor]
MSHSTNRILGPCALALSSLTPFQITFLQSLPKAELHAHLNGCIPISTLQDMAREANAGRERESIPEGIKVLADGVVLDQLGDFFGLFPGIYALTSSPSSLRRAARAVLVDFLGDDVSGAAPGAQCAYLELRSTPRETAEMSRMQYVCAVLDEVERYPADRAALIVSLDRRMSAEVLGECIDVACALRKAGRRVVGVDLCGDPQAGDMDILGEYFARAKAAGLGITLHIAETEANSDAETMRLLSYLPNRLGHATFLNAEAREFVRKNDMCIEICLSSNLLCKTVSTLEAHHIRYYLQHKHPIAICTDDTLPFCNSLMGEYALLLAAPPLGLGLSEAEVTELARMSGSARFPL